MGLSNMRGPMLNYFWNPNQIRTKKSITNKRVLQCDLFFPANHFSINVVLKHNEIKLIFWLGVVWNHFITVPPFWAVNLAQSLFAHLVEGMMYDKAALSKKYAACIGEEKQWGERVRTISLKEMWIILWIFGGNVITSSVVPEQGTVSR